MANSGQDDRTPVPLVTAEEVATLLKVPKSWVYDAARRNVLPHVNLGRYVRFVWADIETWAAGGGVQDE